MKKKIKLAIVDDQKLSRSGLISLTRKCADLEVIIETGDVPEFLELLKNKKPDVVLLDISTPGADEIQVELLSKSHPDLKILLLSRHNEEPMIRQLIEQGARGFLLKDSRFSNVHEAISAVMENGYYFNDHASSSMVKKPAPAGKTNPKGKSTTLSEREIEIVRLICQEYTNKEIAAKLFISSRTVDGHKENILRKTKARNVSGIVLYAVRNHLLNGF
jgi:DNA-binding NarL/FixJ family response regulator